MSRCSRIRPAASHANKQSIIELLDSDQDEDDVDSLLCAPSIFPSSSASAASASVKWEGVTTLTGNSSSSGNVKDEPSSGEGVASSTAAPSAAAAISSSSSTEAAAPSPVRTPLGHFIVKCDVQHSFAPTIATDPCHGNGMAVRFRRVTKLPDRTAIQVWHITGTTEGHFVGAIAPSDAQFLAPILDHVLSHQLSYEASLHSLDSSLEGAVRVSFFGQNPTRKLSKFELLPLERRLAYYLRLYGKALIKPPPPPSPCPPTPSLKSPPPSAAAPVVPPVDAENRANHSAAIAAAVGAAEKEDVQFKTLLGQWRCHPVATVGAPDPTARVKTNPQQQGDSGAIKDLVELRRDSDAYDPRAIHIDQNGSTVASLRPDEASMLVAVWDEFHGSLAMEYQLLPVAADRPISASTPSVLVVRFFTSPNLAATLQKLLRCRLQGFEAEALADKGRGHHAKAHSNGEFAPEIMQLLAEHDVELSTKDWEAQKEALDKMFDEQSKSQIADLPPYPMSELLKPSGGAQKLFQHQVDGIRWLIHQEQVELPPYIKTETTATGRTVWKCEVTHTRFVRQPECLKGGILADDMGLGKTLQTLGLILANPPPGVSYPRQPGRPAATTPRGGRAPTCTLIVSPLTVIANWEHQILLHVNGRVRNKNLLAHTYHGPQRDAKLLLVQQGGIDVLLTSYHTLASDYKNWMELIDGNDGKRGYKKMPKVKKPRKAPYIFDLEFHRIILDEAHIVRSSSTSLWKAVMNLQAKRKLCLTGTPFVNKPTDIHSLLCFLQVQPLCRASVFKEMVVIPIKSRKEIGLATIRATMAHVALRRKKESVLDDIMLVNKSVITTRIQFDANSDHSQTYDALYNTARAYFLKLLNDDDKSLVFQHWMEVLALVLRIRQACVHMSLVPEDYRRRAGEQVEHRNKSTVLEREKGQQLLEFFKGLFESVLMVECAVCMEEMEEENAVILRGCKHAFCGPCWNKIQSSICPMCRQEYNPDDMVKQREAKQATAKYSAKNSLEKHGRSPKIQALFELIEKMKPDEKAVIFSQWTSVLDIVELEFKTYGHTFTRIDGTMDTFQRLDAVMAFETEGTTKADNPRFILCSIMACGTGINLTRGNVVFILDPWWNAAAEVQAMDRVHRIGQTRPVRVYRLIMKDSIEERMLTVQVNKQLLGKGSMEKLKEEEKRKARLTALTDLFNAKDDDGAWH